MIEQIGIAFTGVVAVAITQIGKPQHQRWASVFGLAGQPFWLYAAARTEQWGMLAVCVLYTGMWASGFYRHWIKPRAAALAAMDQETKA